MKTIISAVAIAGLFTFTACNTTAVKEKEMAINAQQRIIDSMKIEMAKKQVIDSMNEVNALRFSVPATTAVPVAAAAAAPAVYYANQSSRRSYAARSTRRAAPRYRQAAAAPVVYQQAPVQTRKKGWSAKAKGAVIGGAGGAIAGAVINKRNRPVGALIGGVLGAGAGTGIGAILDRKNGR